MSDKIVYRKPEEQSTPVEKKYPVGPETLIDTFLAGIGHIGEDLFQATPARGLINEVLYQGTKGFLPEEKIPQVPTFRAEELPSVSAIVPNLFSTPKDIGPTPINKGRTLGDSVKQVEGFLYGLPGGLLKGAGEVTPLEATGAFGPSVDKFGKAIPLLNRLPAFGLTGAALGAFDALNNQAKRQEDFEKEHPGAGRSLGLEQTPFGVPILSAADNLDKFLRGGGRLVDRVVEKINPNLLDKSIVHEKRISDVDERARKALMHFNPDEVAVNAASGAAGFILTPPLIHGSVKASRFIGSKIFTKLKELPFADEIFSKFADGVDPRVKTRPSVPPDVPSTESGLDILYEPKFNKEEDLDFVFNKENQLVDTVLKVEGKRILEPIEGLHQKIIQRIEEAPKVIEAANKRYSENEAIIDEIRKSRIGRYSSLQKAFKEAGFIRKSEIKAPKVDAERLKKPGVLDNLDELKDIIKTKENATKLEEHYTEQLISVEEDIRTQGGTGSAKTEDILRRQDAKKAIKNIGKIKEELVNEKDYTGQAQEDEITEEIINNLLNDLQKGTTKPLSEKQSIAMEMIKNIARGDKTLKDLTLENEQIAILRDKFGPEAVSRLEKTRDIVKQFAQTEAEGSTSVEDLYKSAAIDPLDRELIDLGIEESYRQSVNHEATNTINVPLIGAKNEKLDSTGLDKVSTREQMFKEVQINRSEKAQNKYFNFKLGNPTAEAKLFLTESGRQTVRRLLPTTRLLKHMETGGDVDAKVLREAMFKTRAEELNINGLYYNTPLTPGRPSLYEQEIKLGIAPNSFKDRAISLVLKGEVPIDDFKAGPTAEINRANPKFVKEAAVDRITKLYDTKIDKALSIKEKKLLQLAKQKRLQIVYDYFEPKVSSDLVLNELKTPGNGIFKEGERESLEDMVNFFDSIPRIYKEAKLELLKASQGFLGQGTPVIEMGKIKSIKNGLLKQGFTNKQLEEYDAFLESLAGKSKAAQEVFTNTKARYTPEDFDYMQDLTTLAEKMANDEKIPMERRILDYVYVQSITNPKDFRANTLDEYLKMGPGQELLRAISSPFLLRRSGRYDNIESISTQVQNRIFASARYQTHIPLRELILRTSQNAKNDFTRQIAKDAGERVFGLDLNFLNTFDEIFPLYGDIENGVRNASAQLLGTPKFFGVNAGTQPEIFWSEVGDATRLKTYKYFSNKDNLKLLSQALELTKMGKGTEQEGLVTALTSISPKQRAVGSRGETEGVLDELSSIFGNLAAQHRDKIQFRAAQALLSNPFFAKSEEAVKYQIVGGTLLDRFKTEKEVNDFLKRVVSPGFDKERKLFTNISLKSLNDFGFIMNPELDRNSLSRLPVVNLGLIFTQFPIRLASHMVDWAYRKPEALARYGVTLALIGGPKALHMFQELIDGSVNALSTIAQPLGIEKRETLVDPEHGQQTENLLASGKFGGTASGATAKAIYNLRKAGEAAQTAVLGDSITVGEASLQIGASFDFASTFVKEWAEDVKKSPEAALFALGTLQSLTPLVGFPFAFKKYKDAFGQSIPGSPLSSAPKEIIDAKRGVSAYSKIYDTSVAFPRELINPKVLGARAGVIKFLGVSRSQEVLNGFADEIASLSARQRKISELSRRIPQEEDGTKRLELEAKLESMKLEQALKGKSVITGMKNSYVLGTSSREELAAFINKKMKSVDANVQGQITEVERGEIFKKIYDMEVKEKIPFINKNVPNKRQRQKLWEDDLERRATEAAERGVSLDYDSEIEQALNAGVFE